VYDSSGAGALAAVAYPDRIAMQREAGSKRYLLASGRGVVLAESSGVINARFIVAVQIDGGTGGEGTVFTASSLELAEIRTRFAATISRARVVTWDQQAARVIAREEERLGALLLESRPVQPEREETMTAFLSFAQKQDNLGFLPVSPQFRQFQARVKLLRKCQPEACWPDVSDTALLNSFDTWLGSALLAADHPGRISATDLFAALKEILDRDKRIRLDRDAPELWTVPSGSRIQIDYLSDDCPVMAVKLQELFGLSQTPSIAAGRVPLLLHLLSPAGRPIQVTRDLRSFWDRVYPEVKKELKGRYPKHPWPDDPWSSTPTRGTLKRK
jgi:ATP-dependent helicase HrpB